MGWREASRPVGPTDLPAGSAGPRPGPAAPAAYEAAGAPGSVRLAVGSARPRDRLAVLRRFYPDAEPFAGDNFVYTDPATGKRTLYNPAGLDWGDLPSVTREGAEMLGAAAGGLAGLAGGGPLGAVGGLVAGEALGTAAADQIVDLGLRAFGLPASATPADQALDVAKDTAVGAAGSAGGLALQRLPQAAGRLLARPEAAETADAAARLGLGTPNVGTLGTAPLASTENLAANVLPGSRAAREQGRFLGEVRQAAETAIPGQPLTPGQGERVAGHALKEGTQAAYERFRATRAALDDRVYGAFGRNAAVPIRAVRRVAAELDAFAAQAPESLGPEVAAARDRVTRIIADADANGGRLPLEAFRRIRTTVGDLLESPSTTELPGEAQRRFRDLYGALRTDLYDAARSQSPQALRLLQRHDRLVRAFRGEDLGRESIAKSLDKILKAGSDEAAYSALVNGGGTNRLRNVLNRLEPDQRRIVARAVWDNMLTTPQGNLNLNRLLGQWQKADPADRKLLFGSVTDMNALDDLMTVIGGMKEADRSRNFSNTAHGLIQAALGDRAMTEVMQKVGALAAGGPAALAFPTSTAATVGGSYLLSEALHNPAMARALADAARGRQPVIDESLRRTIGRLVGQITGREAVE